MRLDAPMAGPMHRSKRHTDSIVRRLLGVILLLFVLRNSTSAAPPARFAERVAVNAPAAVARGVAAAQEAAETQQWSAALDHLRPLIESEADEFVEVEPGRYVRASLWANAIIARWPQEGLAVYRQRVDPTAESQFVKAIRERDGDSLRMLAVRWPISGIGDEIAWKAGEDAWRNGRVEAARRSWETIAGLPDSAAPSSLIPFPKPSIAPEIVFVRLILCSIVERDFERAAEELDVFRERFPDATGTVAGQEGNLAERLASTLHEARQWPAGVRYESRFFERGEARPEPAINAIGSLKWLEEHSERDASDSDQMLPQQAFLPMPVIGNGVLFLPEAAAIRAFNVEQGTPAWPSGQPDEDGTIYRGDVLAFQSDQTESSIFSTVTIVEDRLLGFQREWVAPSRDRLLPLESRLVGLDIGDGQGKLVWSQDLNGSLCQSGWTPAGPPVVIQDDAWMAVERSEPVAEIGVARINVEEGTVATVQGICSPLATGDQKTPWSPGWMTAGGGMVFLMTNSGAVAALDRDTGKVRWMATYPIEFTDGGISAQKIMSPPLFWRGLLIAAPAFTGSVFAWNADSGELLWSRRLNDQNLQVAGVAEGNAIITGQQLWALNPFTGQPRWRFGFHHPHGAGSGPATITGSSILWSTRQELFLLDGRQGTVRDRIQLSSLGLRGGSVILSGSTLILCDGSKIAAFQGL